MDMNKLREVIELMEKHGLGEIDLEEENGNRIRVVAAQAPPVAGMAPIVQMAAAPGGESAGAPPAPAEPEPDDAVTIDSPIVGTFYCAPSPDSAPYIDVGAEFDEDTVLCIVEAMKVMNEIKAECKGRIEEILVENGNPVEFGQPLYRISPTE